MQESNYKNDAAAMPPHAKAAVEWFDAALRRAAAAVADDFAKYRLSEALMTLYKLYWDDFSAWYLEIVKPLPNQRIDPQTLDATRAFFDAMLRLLHPFMPFITEELWQNLVQRQDGDTIMLAPMPYSSGIPQDSAQDEITIKNFEFAKQVVSSVRSIRQSNGIPHKQPLPLLCKGTMPSCAAAIVQRLANVSISAADGAPSSAVSFLAGTTEFCIVLDGAVNAEEERSKLEAELDYYRKFLAMTQAKLGNEKFVQNAPPAVIEMERRKQNDAMSKISALQQRLGIA
jgi:valyl-tRNA synthetase